MVKIKKFLALIILMLSVFGYAQQTDKLYLTASSSSYGAITEISALTGAPANSPKAVERTISPTTSGSNLAVGPDPNNLSNVIYTFGNAASGSTLYTGNNSSTNNSGITISDEISGYTADPATGHVYGIKKNSRDLIRVSPAYQNLGFITGNTEWSDSTYNVSNDFYFDNLGNFYTVLFKTGSYLLYRVDTSTLVATKVLTLSGALPSNIQGMAYYNGKVYMAQLELIVVGTAPITLNGFARIYELNLTTGVSILKTSYFLNTFTSGAGLDMDLASSVAYSPPTSDLQVTKTINNSTAPIGSTVVFTVKAKNNGPDNDTNVVVSDLLPSGYIYASSSATAGTYNATTGIWTIGNLNNGASQTLTITATVATTGNYTNTATISGLNIDTDMSNNTATAARFDACDPLSGNIDSDGDGITDICDLDDDNDGILDTDEQACTTTVNRQLNYFFNTSSGNYIQTSDPLFFGGYSSLTHQTGSGVSTTINTDVLRVTGVTTSTTRDNNDYLDFPFSISEAGNFNLSSLALRNTGSGNAYKYDILISSDDFATSTTLVTGANTTGTNNTIYLTSTFTPVPLVPTKMYKIRFYLYNRTGTNPTDFDNISIIVSGCNYRDTDVDGIPDYLDLDSDGDGCPDAIEGAGSFTASQLTTASGNISTQSPNQNFGTIVDANGVPTIVGATGQGIGNSQNEMVNDCISFICPPDPYAAQQTWWLPYNATKTRIDFQSGSAVLNNPAAGFLGQGSWDGFEGNVTVTHPITGEFLFATDGNVVYKGSTGVKATGLAVGGNGSSGEAAAVIPDPNGILGRNFLIIGNSASNTTGSIRMAKYDLETNVVSGLTVLVSGGINEALEVIPHANGTDYWILVSTSDEKVKTYLYSKTTGFNSTPVSVTSVPNLTGVDPNYIAQYSFISWDPRTPGKVLISRHNKVGLANFDPSTGALGTWDVKVTVTSGTTTENSYTGYSVALSPNGRYIYYNEYVQSNNTGILKYYDIQTGLTTTLDTYVAAMNGMKIAPDGRLYKLGFISSNRRLLYLNADANTPPSSPGSLLAFDTGGRTPSLQLPNNVYWGCMTCQSGTAAPALANTNITTNPATVGDLIALLSASNQPAGIVITIHSSATATDANKLANSTAIISGTTYYASFYDGLALCYSPTTAINVGTPYCYKPAVTDSNIYPTKHGITSLGRAGTDSDNWPMVRQSAWTALESKTKGFVVNRVKFNASNQPVADDGTTLVITSPVEGMMVYDTTNNCLKVYTSNDGGSSFAWHCMSTQACPQ